MDSNDNAVAREVLYELLDELDCIPLVWWGPILDQADQIRRNLEEIGTQQQYIGI